MDFDRAEELFKELSDVVDYPLSENSDRTNLCFTLAITSMQFAAAVRALCAQHLMLGASASLRSQYEALVRSVWSLHGASDLQVEKLSADLTVESQQASKNIPSVNQMLAVLEKSPHLSQLMVSLNEFKTSSWLPLNSFVHSGVHAIHWTKYEVPAELIEKIFKISNGLVVLAFQGIGILTGRIGIQTEIIAISGSYASCLPSPR